MTPSVPKLVIIAPFLVASAVVSASEKSVMNGPFGFDGVDAGSIQFTRSTSEPLNLRSSSSAGQGQEPLANAHQTEFSFKLKPGKVDFSKEGTYGLGVLTGSTMTEINSRSTGADGSVPVISPINQGLEYSAGVKIEHEEVDIDGTSYISSSQLGLSYGRLGRLWYGGIDLNLEKFESDVFGDSQSDVLSLDVTTGRRLGFTGLSTHSPLWLLSVQGNFDMDSTESRHENEGLGDWTINPSLFWQNPGFTFSAQMQVPIEFETLNAEGEPDYRLRAVFEKQFK